MNVYHYPSAFFLKEDALYRISPTTDLDSLSVVDLRDRSRAERVVRSAVARCDLARHETPRLLPDIRFVRYLRANAEPGYDVFVCSWRNCEQVYRIDLARGDARRCMEHGPSLQQLAHVFVHPRCGVIERITPTKCWRKANDTNCGEWLRLHMERAAIGRSYWWCPRCRANGRPDRFTLFRQCRDCKAAQAADNAQQPEGAADDSNSLGMRLLPASTATKPQTVAALDMPDADADATLADWLGDERVTSARVDELLRRLGPDAARDPALARQLRAYVLRDSGAGGTTQLDADALEQLQDYAAAKSASLPGVAVPPAEANFIRERFGLSVDYLDGLAVLQLVYGFTVGTADAHIARLQLFSLPMGRHAALTQKNVTEGLLFSLDTERFGEWLAADAKGLRRALLQAARDDPLLARTTMLLHTLSHILVRTSDRHSGVDRERLRELLLPRFGCVLLYVDGGSELGMLRTTYEASLSAWLEGALQSAARCAYDPVCRNSEIRACHACLYLGERTCNTYWNRQLDRETLAGSAGTRGYWR